MDYRAYGYLALISVIASVSGCGGDGGSGGSGAGSGGSSVSLPSSFSSGENLGPGTASAIAVTADGTPHIFYADSTGLRHAYRTGTTWNYETVGATDAGGRIAVLVDAKGAFHGVMGGLYFTNAKGGAWTITVIDSDVDSSDIAISPQGTIGIVSASQATGNQGISSVTYSEISDDVLGQAEQVNNVTAHDGVGVCLAFDAQSSPHIFGNQSSSTVESLWHATLMNSQWETVTLEQQTRYQCGAVADSTGAIHVEYFGDSNSIRLGTWNAGTWQSVSTTLQYQQFAAGPLLLSDQATAFLDINSDSQLLLYALQPSGLTSTVIDTPIPDAGGQVVPPSPVTAYAARDPSTGKIYVAYVTTQIGNYQTVNFSESN